MTEPRTPDRNQRPDPSSSPFERPGVMTGYPLSREEQERVDRVIKESEWDEGEDAEE